MERSRPIAIATLLFGGASLLLGGCSSPAPPQSAHTVTAPRYCARYLVYDMCMLDLNGDGRADLMYFSNTNKVFMYDHDWQERISADFDLHPCAQILDDETKAASSPLLTVPPGGSAMGEMSAKKELFYDYLRYYPKIRACTKQPAEEQPFGDPDMDDFSQVP